MTDSTEFGIWNLTLKTLPNCPTTHGPAPNLPSNILDFEEGASQFSENVMAAPPKENIEHWNSAPESGFLTQKDA